MERPTIEELRDRRLRTMSADERVEFDEALVAARLALEVRDPRAKGGRSASDVTVSIDDAPHPRRGLAGIADSVKRLHEATPSDARDDLPADLAMNKKHYLYGHSPEG
jgi:hypothetical protein